MKSHEQDRIDVKKEVSLEVEQGIAEQIKFEVNKIEWIPNVKIILIN